MNALPPSDSVRRAVYAAAGCACVAVGAVGAVVPVLPTTVFLLAASFLFARSCPELQARLLGRGRLGESLRRFEETRAMPRRAKAHAVATMWGGIALGAWLTRGLPPWVALALVALGLAGSAAILFAVRTERAYSSST